ncbi:hypothetical protein B0H12DRAFT_1241254 [Mycena haematopus]|nr:hypothetical protein B0H12DRAFT_1241254 [Mycena haematopus]
MIVGDLISGLFIFPDPPSSSIAVHSSSLCTSSHLRCGLEPKHSLCVLKPTFMAAVLFNQVLKVPQGHVLQAVFLKLGVLASSLLSRFWVFLMCSIFIFEALFVQLNPLMDCDS